MVKAKNLVFIGPISDKTTGQSLVFQLVNLNVQHSLTINTTRFNSKVLSSIYVILKCLWLLFQPYGSILYFTCSRSNFGFIKDFFIIWISHFKSMIIINHIHGSDFHTFSSQKGIIGTIIRLTYRRITHTIILLKEMENQLSNFPGVKYSIIPNCYPGEMDIFGLDFVKSVPFVITYFSNLMYSKGIINFLESAQSLINQGYNVKFKIAGYFMSDEFFSEDKIKNEFFKRLNGSNDYSGSIAYLGPLSGDSKNQLLAESSVFVLPTFYRSEAFPISIIEAMRMGNAIITTNFKYLPYLVNEKNGIIIPPNDNSSLTMAISDLVTDKEKLVKIQKFNTEEAINYYSQKNFLGRINDLFNYYLSS